MCIAPDGSAKWIGQNSPDAILLENICWKHLLFVIFSYLTYRHYKNIFQFNSVVCGFGGCGLLTSGVDLSFPSSKQEDQQDTWTEWNRAKKHRELREFNWSHWSLDIWLRTLEVFAGVFAISGCSRLQLDREGQIPARSRFECWKSFDRIVGVWVQGMLQKSQCDLPHVKLPQAFLLQGRVSWIDLSFYCEFLSTSFFF